jgi:hypothetical protein
VSDLNFNVGRFAVALQVRDHEDQRALRQQRSL